MSQSSQRTPEEQVQAGRAPLAAAAPRRPRDGRTPYPLTEALSLEDFLYLGAPSKAAPPPPAAKPAPAPRRLEASEVHQLEGYAESLLRSSRKRALTTHLQNPTGEGQLGHQGGPPFAAGQAAESGASADHVDAAAAETAERVAEAEAAGAGSGGAKGRKRRGVMPDQRALHKFAVVESKLAQVFGPEA